MGDLKRKPLPPALVGHRRLAHSGIETRKGRDVETVGAMPKGVSTMSTSKFKAPLQDDSTSVEEPASRWATKPEAPISSAVSSSEVSTEL